MLATLRLKPVNYFIKSYLRWVMVVFEVAGRGFLKGGYKNNATSPKATTQKVRTESQSAAAIIVYKTSDTFNIIQVIAFNYLCNESLIVDYYCLHFWLAAMGNSLQIEKEFNTFLVNNWNLNESQCEKRAKWNAWLSIKELFFVTGKEPHFPVLE